MFWLIEGCYLSYFHCYIHCYFTCQLSSFVASSVPDAAYQHQTSQGSKVNRANLNQVV